LFENLYYDGGSMKRQIRIIFFSPRWGFGLSEAAPHLDLLPKRDLRSKVTNPRDPELLRMARLDCDWDGECLRAFAALQHPDLEFLPALIADSQGLVDFMKQGTQDRAVPWLIVTDQNPAIVEQVIGKLLDLFRRCRGRVLYWSYDEASRAMRCFAGQVAPYLSILLHDETPLADEVLRALPGGCRTVHMSWVANVVPFAYAFREEVEEKIVFLGSKPGVTPHRREQIQALKRHFKDRFTAITDHSVPVQDRGQFAGIKVHLCPEGRKFSTEGMRLTHTDRPFWSGCMGQVPVIEDSKWGGRLAQLVEAGVLFRYAHDDTRSMIEACERALAVDTETRRRIYQYFNLEGTVGPVVARLIAEYYNPGR
jgi:hypothetical protein